MLDALTPDERTMLERLTAKMNQAARDTAPELAE
jgi:hypothetical protein